MPHLASASLGQAPFWVPAHWPPPGEQVAAADTKHWWELTQTVMLGLVILPMTLNKVI